MMKKIFLIIFILLIIIQFIPIDQTNITIDKHLEISTPKDIKHIFKQACYDCHSNQTVWPYYSKIAPFSWIISSHVNDGRKALNFSTWNTYTQEIKDKKKKAIFRKVYASMPLASYILLHEEANISKKQREFIRKWTGIKKY